LIIDKSKKSSKFGFNRSLKSVAPKRPKAV
ncbi:MAG: hypothetical protein ACI92C_002270, partial [Neolewinella sp.]